MNETVEIYEVGPRDGLQNEMQMIPIDTKVRFINYLSDSGIKSIETGSIVSAKWVPQMASSADVFERIKKHDDVVYSLLIPNEKGFDEALRLNAKRVGVFSSVSETFCQKNTNCSIAESLERFVPVFARAKENNIAVRAYLSCVWGCPYEGDVSLNETVKLAKKLASMGAYQIVLSDTIGIATPNKIKSVLDAVLSEVQTSLIACHFHDTYGQAAGNVYQAVNMGIRTIDSSIAGLGGCPYAKGASGNVATEDVVYLLEGMGFSTNIDWEKLLKASTFIANVLSIKPRSKVTLAKLG